MKELVLAVYDEISRLNHEGGYGSIPRSDEFCPHLSENYGIFPHMVPVVLDILHNAHLIFIYRLVEEDRKQKIRPVEGYVITKGDVIKKLRSFYEQELVQKYTREFTRKLSPEKIIEDILPKHKEYNNTEIGILVNTFTMLLRYEIELERNISDYNKSAQERILEQELERYDSRAVFISPDNKKVSKQDKSVPGRIQKSSVKKTVESSSEQNSQVSVASLERTIAVYGIEFYTRLCFRDYNFRQVYWLIQEGVIHRAADLKTVKKILATERTHADVDLKLQSFASDINELDKLINTKLKS